MCVHAGLLVLADVVVQHLAAHTQCAGLLACQVKDAQGLVPELREVPPKTGVYVC